MIGKKAMWSQSSRKVTDAHHSTTDQSQWSPYSLNSWTISSTAPSLLQHPQRQPTWISEATVLQKSAHHHHRWSDERPEQQGTVDVILLDVAKAFDKVPNRQLLQKVEECGVRENILKWITSFLQNRTHQVVLEGQTSAPMNVLSEVPRGTVLGPLLFLIYINGLLSNVKSTARDDTIVYRKV